MSSGRGHFGIAVDLFRPHPLASILPSGGSEISPLTSHMSHSSRSGNDEAQPIVGFDPALDSLDQDSATDDLLAKTMTRLIQLHSQADADASDSNSASSSPRMVSIDDLLARFELGPKLGDAPWPAEFLDDDEALQIPLRIGNLQRLRPVRMGRHAYLCSAFDDDAGRVVAVKFPRRNREGQPFSLRKEIQCLKQIADDHVITLRGTIDHGDNTLAVMDWVDGDSLAGLRSIRPLNEPEASAIGEKIVRGLAAIHAAGWVHHDLKPDNVMVGWRGTVKLVDFGTAMRIGDPLHHGNDSRGDEIVGSSHSGLGTVGFMPPEQAIPTRLFHASNPAADYFSLGMTLIDLMGGSVPPLPRSLADDFFQNVTASNRWRDMMQRAIPSHVSSEFGELLIELTRLNPDQRLTDPTGIADAFAAFAGSETTIRVVTHRRQPSLHPTASSIHDDLRPPESRRSSRSAFWMLGGLTLATALSAVCALWLAATMKPPANSGDPAAASMAVSTNVAPDGMQVSESERFGNDSVLDAWTGVWSVTRIGDAAQSNRSVRIVLKDRLFYWLENDGIGFIASVNADGNDATEPGEAIALLLKPKAVAEATRLIRCHIATLDEGVEMRLDDGTHSGRTLTLRARGPMAFRDAVDGVDIELRNSLNMIADGSSYAVKQRNRLYRSGYRPPWPLAADPEL